MVEEERNQAKPGGEAAVALDAAQLVASVRDAAAAVGNLVRVPRRAPWCEAGFASKASQALRL